MGGLMTAGTFEGGPADGSTDASAGMPTGGPVAAALAGARGRLAAAAAVAGGAGTLVEGLRIRLAAVAGGALAQVNAEVDGRRIRVQRAAAEAGDSLDRVADCLLDRIRAVTGAWVPRPWSAAQPPVPLLPLAGGRRIVRRKDPSLVWCTPEAAARTMDAMDYDIHLFTDPATETDAVVYRVGPTGYRLARTMPAGPFGRRTAPITLSPHGAPLLTERQAVERLERAELPFLFYAHPAGGRGRVLYRRFDGHLGLLAGRS
ncbi:sigma 54 modulation/S30EA ribosomal C-terminal domain-containing protein [Kitasatospora sp. NPDC089797]|uniref:sigma 54 modulation/S30EA ribosomal C-terminal domain-containing protein n=1 Tax=Kitasatospora sp. NPDC089797 TaxID=3155298 RepID=UPI003433B3CE